jgi:two-component system, sensor histidine kinase and response regulator
VTNDRPVPTILVVDDNAENRALARATLEDEGYRVVTASGGDEAIELFEVERPDCVLLDIRMPGTDGFAVCARIRASSHGADTPVVFLTALRDVDTFDRALRAGGDDFLTKPVRPTELVIRVQAALKLRRMSAELREQYDLVRRQRDDLIRLQLQKERLTAFVVHDLKNPVNAMDLHAQLLLRNRALPADARESVTRIRTDARTLLRLVLNLLDIAKSEEDALIPRLEEIDVEALTAEVVSASEVLATLAEVKLERQIELRRLRADPDLLRRVLENLLDNAIRHVPNGTVVRLIAAREGDSAAFRVADSGHGIPPEMREKIFDRFVQLESGERVVERAGRGLGLAFCKLAVEAHGGTIRVEDSDGGAVFCVRLPDER